MCHTCVITLVSTVLVIIAIVPYERVTQLILSITMETELMQNLYAVTEHFSGLDTICTYCRY